MAVYTNANALRISTQRSGGRNFSTALSYGHPYVSIPRDERLVAAASGGQATLRAGIEQDNYVLAPNADDSWYSVFSGSVSEGANDGHVGALNSIVATASGSDLAWGIGQSPPISAGPAEAWNFSAYFKNDGTWAAYYRLYVDVYEGGVYQTTFDLWQPLLPTDATWKRRSMTFYMPDEPWSDVTWVPHVFMSRADGTDATAGTVAQFSGVQATRGEALREFFSGDWGGSWRGVPNFSNSYRLV